MPKFPSLYLVTDRKDMNKDVFLKKILEAVKGGVGLVQLREKNTKFIEFCEIGRLLKDALDPLNIPLIINDRIDVALAINANGVHLGQQDIPIKEARDALGKRAIIGLSINKVEQMKTLEEMEHISYVAASPVFATKTKQDCTSPLGLTALKEISRFSPLPVIGIGGINSENVTQILQCGVSSVAVVSAILKAPCPLKAAKKLLSKIREFHENV